MTPTLSLTQSFCASLCIYAVSTGHAFLSLLYLFMLSAFLYASVHPHSVHCSLPLPTLLSCLTVSCFSGYSSPPFLSCSCCACLCACILCVFSLTPSLNIPYLFFSIFGSILELKKGDSVLLSVQKKGQVFSVFVQGKKLEMNYFSIFFLINVKSNVYPYFLHIVIILADFILVFTIMVIYREKQVKSSILEPKEYIS